MKRRHSLSGVVCACFLLFALVFLSGCPSSYYATETFGHTATEERSVHAPYEYSLSLQRLEENRSREEIKISFTLKQRSVTLTQRIDLKVDMYGKKYYVNGWNNDPSEWRTVRTDYSNWLPVSRANVTLDLPDLLVCTNQSPTDSRGDGFFVLRSASPEHKFRFLDPKSSLRLPLSDFTVSPLDLSANQIRATFIPSDNPRSPVVISATVETYSLRDCLTRNFARFVENSLKSIIIDLPDALINSHVKYITVNALNIDSHFPIDGGQISITGYPPTKTEIVLRNLRSLDLSSAFRKSNAYLLFQQANLASFLAAVDVSRYFVDSTLAPFARGLAPRDFFVKSALNQALVTQSFASYIARSTKDFVIGEAHGISSQSGSSFSVYYPFDYRVEVRHPNYYFTSRTISVTSTSTSFSLLISDLGQKMRVRIERQ